MGVHIREGYHGNLIVEYVNERGVSHPFCTLLKNGESYQIYISPRVPVMSVDEFFDACYDIEEHIDGYESVDITVPNFSSLTQKGIDELKSKGIRINPVDEQSGLNAKIDSIIDDVIHNSGEYQGVGGTIGMLAKEQAKLIIGLASDLKRIQEDMKLREDFLVDPTPDGVNDTHYIPFTKQELLDLHDSLCDLITYLDYQIDKLP